MFSLAKILAPVDFSERCVGAARYVEALAERFGSEVILLHVIPPPHYEFSSMEVGGTVLNELFASRESYLRKEMDSFLKQDLPRLQARRVLVSGDPARKIIEYAHQERADLIVMPTHGYGPLRRFILGSVTAKILHDADCPVWTGVHLEEAPAVGKIQFRSILAALDLGEQSRKTLAWATELAKAYAARLVIVHAAPSIEGHAGEYFDPDWRLHLAKQAKEEIATLQESVAQDAEVFVESGDAPQVVCDSAVEFKADLLVIGRGSAAGVFGRLRANAYSIIRESPCPVVSV